MIEQNCSRCESTIERPHEENGNYVIADDFIESVEREVIYGLVHTDETMQRVRDVAEKLPERNPDTLAAEMAREGAPETVMVPDGTETVETADGGTIETATRKEVQFNIPQDEFDHVKLSGPAEARDNSDIALTFQEREEQDVQKSAVVCEDCTEDTDEIIWGVSE